MPDGWTETTYPYNIDKIIEIYEKHGGVRIWDRYTVDTESTMKVEPYSYKRHKGNDDEY